MSLTGRPSRPPLALTSSSQICIASSDILPLAASGPVSAMPNPILIGSAAVAGIAAVSIKAAAASHRTPVRRNHVNVALMGDLLVGWPNSPSRRLAPCYCAILQHHRRGGSIRDRNVIVAVQFGHRSSEGAAHRHPVEKFDALRAGFLDQVMDRQPRQHVRLVDDLVHAELIELGVDKAGAFAVEL